MSSRLDAVPTATGRDWTTAIALVALVAAFGSIAGPLGALAGVSTALVGYVLGTPYALALGHVALVACTPDGTTLRSIVITETAFVVILLVPVRRTVSPSRIALVAIASALVLTGAAWLVVGSYSIWLAAITMLALLAAALYGIHRLMLVRLGLVPTSDDGDSSPTDGLESTAKSSAETTDI